MKNKKLMKSSEKKDSEYKIKMHLNLLMRLKRNSSDPESMTRIKTSELIKCLPESFILKISLALMPNSRSENLLVWILSGVIRA